MTTSPDKTYVCNPDIVMRRVDDSVFLVNSDNQTLYHLNSIGAALWRLMAEPVSADEAVDTIHRAFPDMDRAQIADDIKGLIRDLAGNNLVQDV